MKIFDKFKIKLYSSGKIIVLLLLMVPFLSGCRVDEASYELTNFKGKSIESFEKKTRTQLVEKSNRVYLLDDSLQLIASKEKISSIMILEGSSDYKLFNIEIGMDRVQA